MINIFQVNLSFKHIPKEIYRFNKISIENLLTKRLSIIRNADKKIYVL